MNKKPVDKNLTLHVLVTNNDGSFFGRGLELDYAAQGYSKTDLEKCFIEGLLATFRENVKRKTIDKFLSQISPWETWKTYYYSKYHSKYQRISSYHFKHQYSPFSTIYFKFVKD